MKRLVFSFLGGLLIAAVASCDTPPERASTGNDAGVTQQAVKVIPSPDPRPIGGGGGGVPDPIAHYCEARYQACSNLCHDTFGGWCGYCEQGCEFNCQQEYGQCVFH